MYLANTYYNHLRKNVLFLINMKYKTLLLLIRLIDDENNSSKKDNYVKNQYIRIYYVYTF